MATQKKKAKKPTKKKTVKKKAAKKGAHKPAKKKAAKKKGAKKKVVKAKKPAAKKAVKKSASKKAPAPQQAKPAAAKEVAVSSGPHPLEGASLPNVTLTNQRGEEVNLGSLTGTHPKVVLYFYPKDDTPGCTKEACDFRDNMNRIQDSGVTVVGVSPDDAESHQKFIDKYGLNFDLLTDTNHALADAMKVWKEKSFMGKNYMGVERSTFLIKDGQIAKAWQPVKVEGHVDEVLKASDEA